MKDYIRKIQPFVFIFLLIILILEFVFLFSQKNFEPLTSITDTTISYAYRKYLPLVLGLSLQSAAYDTRYDNMILIAKTEIQYQGKVNSLRLSDNKLWLELKDTKSQRNIKIFIILKEQPLLVKDDKGKEVGIDEIKIGDIIKIYLLYNYKEGFMSGLVQKLSK
jgi:hypothetical protein